MESILNETAVVIAISCAGVFFMTGLVTGGWKLFCMRHSKDFKAPYYVDIAHRSSLMYSFAAILIATFAYLSAFSDTVNTIATILPLLFFAIAILKYITLGIANETNNQLRDSKTPHVDKTILAALMIAEIGGFSVLLLGFFRNYI